MATVYFITHPDVLIDPTTPVPDWRLNPRGIERMRAMLKQNWVPGIVHVASSTERKAFDGATILAAHLNLTVVPHPGLGENDRSSTGYLPKAEFEAVANAFFAHPEQSVRGWERAADAQARIFGAMRDVLRAAPSGDVAIVSHGGVGALLLCQLQGTPITRETDQPAGSGGYLLAFDRADWKLRHRWRAIDG
ncbi:MAG: histidine phosphatase family protein [Acetobacteraceae bacterium]|jgi:broad specificity phosphatase PhoE